MLSKDNNAIPGEAANSNVPRRISAEEGFPRTPIEELELPGSDAYSWKEYLEEKLAHAVFCISNQATAEAVLYRGPGSTLHIG